jgi:hypothetical protein
MALVGWASGFQVAPCNLLFGLMGRLLPKRCHLGADPWRAPHRGLADLSVTTDQPVRCFRTSHELRGCFRWTFDLSTVSGKDVPACQLVPAPAVSVMRTFTSVRICMHTYAQACIHMHMHPYASIYVMMGALPLSMCTIDNALQRN